MKKDSKKRALSVLLCLTMVVSLYSTLTFADDEGLDLGTGSDGTYDNVGLMDTGTGTGTGNGTGTGTGVAPSNGEGEGVHIEDPEAEKNSDDDYVTPESYFVFDASTGSITGYDKSATLADGKLVIPAQIGGVDVVKIGRYAFSSNNSIITLDFEEGSKVKKIDANGFSSCKNLVEITLPESMDFAYFAFQSCSSLKKVNFPENTSFKSISYEMFDGCTSLESIVIPEGITAIDTGAFYGCSSLTDITLPESLTCIDHEAFMHCKSLNNVTIPESVMTIQIWAFWGCTSLTEIDIPANVGYIGNYAFRDCTNLADITIGEGSRPLWINESAFENCTSLVTLTIPDRTYRIGEWGGGTANKIFTGCTALTDVYVMKEKDSILKSPWGAPDTTVVHWLGGTPAIAFDYENCYLKGFTPGETYTINGTVIAQKEDGTLDIPEDWYGTTLSIVRKASDYYATDSKVQTLEIPKRDDAPTGLGAVNETALGANDGQITGVSPWEMEYKPVGADVWTDCTSDTITGLAIGTYQVRYKYYCTDTDIPSKEATVVIGTEGIETPDNLQIDYAAGKITGLDPSRWYTVNGASFTPDADGSIGIQDDWYGTTLTIIKSGSGTGPDITETIMIPAKTEAPTGLGVINASGEGTTDGAITGVTAEMEYRALNDGAISWTTCTEGSVTGLPAGMYEVRIKSINGSFASNSAKVEIGIAEPDALSVDYEKAQITGLDPSSTYTINGETVTPSKDGTLDIDKAWYGTEITIEKTASGSGASITEKIAIPKKADAPTGVSVVNASGNDKNDGQITGVSPKMEYGLVPEDGTAITWKDCTGDTVTGLAPGKYDVRIKAINGETFASEPVEVTIGVIEPSKSDDSSKDSARDDDSYSKGKDDKGNTGGSTTTTDPTTPVNPTPTTPVTPDPTTPVAPDPVTPVTTDPATPTTPDQGTTGDNTGNQDNAGSNTGNQGGSGNSGSSATTTDRDSDDDRDSSSSSHRTSSHRGNSSSSSSSSSTNGTSGSTDAATGNQDATGTTTDDQGSSSNSASHITASIITDATSIAQTVKDKLDSALTSILKKDSKVQTGPYVKSDSDDIKVEIPAELQQADRSFYLMTSTDDGDIVVLPNESTQDNMFEAQGEADTDYQMIFEDGETPLAGMITDAGVLDMAAAETNCYNHLVGLGLALLGLIAAALLAKKGKRYFWAASVAGILLALVASATGSCHLDWICFAGEAIVAVAATAALMLKKISAREQ